MNETISIAEYQKQKDSEHLKLIAVFHFVIAGLSILGIAFVFLHYFVMNMMFSDPGMWEGKGAPPPKEILEFFKIFVWFYLFAGVMLAVAGVVNILSGVFMIKRKNRIFSLVVAGLNCLQVPFGTALGVFTIVVLLRDSVREAYEGADESN